jgi:hypothetical protein
MLQSRLRFLRDGCGLLIRNGRAPPSGNGSKKMWAGGLFWSSRLFQFVELRRTVRIAIPC